MPCTNFPNIIRCLLHPSDDGRSASGKSKKPRLISTGHKRREDRAATVPVGSPSGSVSIFMSSAWFSWKINQIGIILRKRYHMFKNNSVLYWELGCHCRQCRSGVWPWDSVTFCHRPICECSIEHIFLWNRPVMKQLYFDSVSPLLVWISFLHLPIFVVATSCDPLAPVLIGVLYLDDVLGVLHLCVQ